MQGQLFTQDFLTRGVLETPPHEGWSENDFSAFSNALHGLFKGLDGTSTINEAQTEQPIINKVLAELGGSDDTLPQVNADPKGREAVPDCLLFASPQAKAAALAETKEDRHHLPAAWPFWRPSAGWSSSPSSPPSASMRRCPPPSPKPCAPPSSERPTSAFYRG